MSGRARLAAVLIAIAWAVFLAAALTAPNETEAGKLAIIGGFLMVPVAAIGLTYL